MAREDLIASAVSFLQDPSVGNSPVEKQIAFLQSKNLTQEEIDAALARAGEETPPSNPVSAPAAGGYGYRNQQVMRRAPPAGYGRYEGDYWQQPPPPEIPRRDWRDWFIMATVMGGVSYGLYFVAKRYIQPLIAPPTPPQLEQDKQSIDESFNKAFALLDQLTTDTESLKTSEQARTERLDSALHDVESVMGELKAATRKREDEGRRMNDEVRLLKDLIPKGLEAQKESNDTRLRELSTELKSLKTLIGNRMGNTAPTARPSSGTGSPSGSQSPMTNGMAQKQPSQPAPGAKDGGSGAEETAEKPSESAQNNKGSMTPGGRPTSTPFGSSAGTGNRAAIPAWQMAAASKASGSTVGAAAEQTEASAST